jgi:hypothetical protein
LVKKYGVDLDESDKESRDAAEDYVKQEIARDWSYEELQRRYQNLKAVALKNLPNLWMGLEFALSVKTVLNIKGNTLPFVGILLGPASSMKTVIIELFREYDLALYSDSFSPKGLVSHNSSLSEQQLRKVDLLPRMRNKLFLTPELSPLFGSKEDDLNQVIHILIRIADGQGFESDSGAKGHRGYAGEMMFVWLGAAVNIPYKVHKLLGNLGPKLYFFRLPRIEEGEDEYFSRRNDNFRLKRNAVKEALFDYLLYFDSNPSIIFEQEDEYTRLIWKGINNDKGNSKDNGNSNGNSTKNDKKGQQEDDMHLPPKIEMYEDIDNENADRIIIRLCIMLAHLRAIVPTWETHGIQGSGYGFTMPLIEDPTRAMTQMRNLARGHALSRGRLSFTREDIPMIVHTVMSTATSERVRIFEILLENTGVLTTTKVCDFLEVSRPTALKTMLELKVAGLVDIPYEDTESNEKRIILKDKFKWFLTKEFAALKQGHLDECNEEEVDKEKNPPRCDDDIVLNEELSLDNTQNTECNTGMRGGEFSLCAHNKEMKGVVNDNTIDGPYSCPYCDNRFATDDLYRKHVKSHKG